MARAVIVASEEAPDDDVTRLGLKEGEAQRTPTPKE